MLVDSIKDAIEKEHEISEKINLYINLAEAYKNYSSEQAIDIAEQALNLALGIDDQEKIGMIYYLIGDISLLQDKLSRSEASYLLAIDHLQIAEAGPSLIRVHMALGNRYIERENYPEAMDHYLKAVRISEEVGEIEKLPNLYNNLGVLYLKLNNTRKALELYSKALKLFESLSDTVNVAGTTTNIGSIYLQLGEYAIARDYYEKGFRLFRSIGHQGGQAHALFKLGTLEEMLGNYEEAETDLLKSLELQKKMEAMTAGSRVLFLAETYVNLGKVYLLMENHALAEKYLMEGYDLAYQEDYYTLLVLASENLSSLFRKQKQFELALDYYTAFKQFSDSLYNEGNVKKITQLEMQHQFDTKMKEAELNRQVETQKRKRENFVYIGISVGLLLVLIIAVLLLRLEKNKKRKLETDSQLLREKLDHANKELTTYVMYLLRKNEFILSIIEKLKRVRLDASAENKIIIAEMINELKSNTDTISWEEFEVRFQQVHTAFYTNLRKKFPDLTNNEIRLCAFFRLNMTSKEIAAITYQSLNSIKVGRYRLRKKLDLPQEENLIAFLSDF